MLPLANTLIDTGTKLSEAALRAEGLRMEDVDNMDEYLAYRDAFIQKA
jgi:hypothetical protein